MRVHAIVPLNMGHHAFVQDNCFCFFSVIYIIILYFIYNPISDLYINDSFINQLSVYIPLPQIFKSIGHVLAVISVLLLRCSFAVTGEAIMAVRLSKPMLGDNSINKG